MFVWLAAKSFPFTNYPVLAECNNAIMKRMLVLTIVLSCLSVSGCGFTRTVPGVAQLKVLSPNVDFGTVTVGSRSWQTVTIFNSGTTPLNISQATVTGNGFATTGLVLPITLPAGQRTSFRVWFAPTSKDNATGEISFVDNAANSETAIVLSGTGVTTSSVAAIIVSPPTLPFGNMNVGSSSTQAVTVSNTGATNLVISQATVTGSEFSINGLTAPLTIAAGQNYSFIIRFAPRMGRSARGNISLVSNAPNSPTVIALSGNGVGMASPAAINVNPSTLAFGNMNVGGSSTQAVTVSNTGSTNLVITQATITGSGFSTSGLTAPLTIAAGQSQSFNVSFVPAATGKLIGSITLVGIAANPQASIPAVNSPATIALAGNGVQAPTKPPVISGVSSSSIKTTSAVISWSTDEGSTSQVDYGTSISYGNSSQLVNSAVTSHSVTLSGLNANTQYHFRGKSQDAGGNLATSGDFTFTTLALPVASTTTVYGAALNSDGLANLEIGKYSRKVSYRFRAGKSGPVQSVLVYIKANSLGYFAGNGGQVLVELQADDGTAAHLPSGTVLAQSIVLSNLLPPSLFNRTFSFTTQPALVQGTIYHLVFINSAPDPLNNYVSINNIYNQRGTQNMQPGVSDVDLAVLFTDASTPWGVTYFHTPIFSLNFADGTSQGQGNIDALVGSAASINGSSQVRETFTVTGSNKVISAVSVRLQKQGSPGNLTIRLEAQDGALIEQGTVSASSVSATYNWVTYSFNANHTLIVGESYNLILSAPAGDSYQMYPIQKGVLYGFNPPAVFGDGHYQRTTGSGWVDLQGNRTDFDMQFYFTLAPTP